jgi:hypothetical protein
MTERGRIDRESNPGDRPIRMKGFYRAVKNKEPWAVRLNNIKSPEARVLAMLYSRVDFKKLSLSGGPFFSRGYSGFCGKINPVPFYYIPNHPHKRKRSRYRSGTAE